MPVHEADPQQGVNHTYWYVNSFPFDDDFWHISHFLLPDTTDSLQSPDIAQQGKNWMSTIEDVSFLFTCTENIDNYIEILPQVHEIFKYM